MAIRAVYEARRGCGRRGRGPERAEASGAEVAIELVGGHPANRDAVFLGEADDGGQPLVGAGRDMDHGCAPRAQRFEHRVDAVDAHSVQGLGIRDQGLGIRD